MATERTPPQKRIVRAEKGRDEWKLKAAERRVKAMKLKFTSLDNEFVE